VGSKETVPPLARKWRSTVHFDENLGFARTRRAYIPVISERALSLVSEELPVEALQVLSKRAPPAIDDCGLGLDESQEGGW